MITVAMGIDGLEEPYPVFEPERPVGQRADRADVYNIADKIMIERLLDIGGDLRVIAAIQDAMLPLVGKLVGRVYAAEAHDAPRHMELDIGPEVVLFKCSFRELKSRCFQSVVITEVLQAALACLVAYRAIQRVI